MKEERKKMGMVEDIRVYKEGIHEVEEGLDELREEREMLERYIKSSAIRRERIGYEQLILGRGILWSLIGSRDSVGADYIEESGMERVLKDAGGFPYEVTIPYTRTREIPFTGERVLPDSIRETLRGLYEERERLEKESAGGRLRLEDGAKMAERVYEFIPRLEGVLEEYKSLLREKMRDRTSSD